MTIEQAIQKAIEGGWKGWQDNNEDFHSLEITINGVWFYDKGETGVWLTFSEIFLDPYFWQSLGKAMGWREEYPKAGVRIGTFIEWKQMWHRFIDHLAEGKSAEDFFNTLTH